MELRPPDHLLADAACLPQRRCYLRIAILCRFAQQKIELFVKEIADEFRRVKNRRASLIKNFDFVRMLQALGDHQAVDAIGPEIFHVTIEKTRSLAPKHAIATPNPRTNRYPG